MQNQFSNWRLLMPAPPDQLQFATLQLHLAAQLLATLSRTLLPKKDDDSHTNMEWAPQRNALISNWILEQEVFRLALLFPDFTLEWWNHDNDPVLQLPLQEQTIPSAMQWIVATLQETFGVPMSINRLESNFTLPPNLSDSDEDFKKTSRAVRQMVADYYNNGNIILKYFAQLFTHASPVRTWPHHFDIGSYIPVKFDKKGEAIASIGIGLAIPDEYVNDFYFYVNHWSKAGDVEGAPLPDLPGGGYWNTKDWTGAVLKMESLLTEKEALAQAQCAKAFLEKGIQNSLTLIGEA